MGTQRANLDGLIFGYWTVLRFSHRGEDRRVYWLCRCRCSREEAVSTYSLTARRSTKCQHCVRNRFRHKAF